jgi:hypothetical protein
VEYGLETTPDYPVCQAPMLGFGFLLAMRRSVLARNPVGAFPRCTADGCPRRVGSGHRGTQRPRLHDSLLCRGSVQVLPTYLLLFGQ